MATHAIGSGTCNLSVNLRREERSALGRAAFRKVQSGEFRSVGDFVRGMIHVGLKATDPNAGYEFGIARTRVVVRVNFNQQTTPERKAAA